jgi:hypothetical protein
MLHVLGGSPQSVVLRWLLGLLILAITFAIGLKIGEFKAGMWDQGFGPGMGNMHYQMMQGWNGNPPFPPTMMQPSWGVPESGSGVANPDTTAPIKPVPQKKTTTPNTTK